MANKEATIYIVDVGRSMGKIQGGRDETNLDWALKFVWDKITATVQTGRKTATVGVIGLRTDGATSANSAVNCKELNKMTETDNELAEDDPVNNANLSYLHEISQVLMPHVRKLRKDLVPSDTNDGDAISAIVLATHLIGKYCKHLKYAKHIYLVTDGCGEMDLGQDETEQIAEKLKADGIQLTVLGVDFDDEDYGYKEPNKPSRKRKNESLLQKLTEECEGVFGTLAEAISNLDQPRMKEVKPVPSYRGLLTLGDNKTYDSALSIDVERFPRTMIQRPPTASSYVHRTGAGVTQSDDTVMNGADDDRPDSSLAAVKSARQNQVADEVAPGGKRDVPDDELAKGFLYGRTAVYINESERNVTDLEVQPCLDIIGFVEWKDVPRYFAMSRTNMIIPKRSEGAKAAMALSSFAHALYELQSYAIARFVAHARSKPVVLLLAPEISADYECLIDVEIPFSEDIRQHRFPPLDRVITVSGKTITEHRNLPGDNLMQAMSDYVDAMDISTFGRDEDDQACEYARVDETYSPALHQIQKNIQWRAARGDDSLAPIMEILTRYTQPPTDLVEKAKSRIDALTKAGEVKKVPPRQKGRKRTRETEKPLSGLDVDELLGREKRTKISAENAVPEFKQLLASADDFGAIKDGASQLGDIIRTYIQHSVGDSGYGRAIEALRVMREELVDFEEPAIYNEFLRDLKQRILGGSLGGERRDMWLRIRGNRLGLIDKNLSPLSKVTEEEAKQFMSARSSV